MRLALVSLLIAFLTHPVSASLILSSPDQTTGTGLGAVNTVLTIQTPSGSVRTESGCVSWNGMSNVTGPPACPSGFAGGDEQGVTQTRTIGELGLDSAFNLRLVFNYNEDVNDNVTLENMELRIFGADGTVLFESGAFSPNTFTEPFSGTGNAGFVYRLDAEQALEANQYFDDPDNRIGLAATVTGAEGGIETFYVANADAIDAPEADVSVTKFDSTDPVEPRATLTYTLTASNDGPNTATSVTVADVLPSSVDLVGYSSTKGTCIPANSSIVCSIDELLVGEDAVITIDVQPQTEGTILNSAVISADQADPDTSNNSANERTTVAQPTQADLRVIKTDSVDPVKVGDPVDYRITVINDGSDPATSVWLTDNLPSSVSIVNVLGAPCSVSGQTVSCELGTLNSGQAEEVTITVKPTSTGEIVNRVSVGAEEDDPNTTNNTAAEPTTVTPRTADLSVIKDDTVDPATQSVPFDYELTVRNDGPDLVENVTVRDVLPESVNFVAAWTNAGSCSVSGRVVTCDLGQMPVNGTTFIEITVEPTVDNVTLLNSVTVSSEAEDTDPSNNSDEEVTQVGGGSANQADVSVTKTDGTDPVIAGQELTYTITVDNAGPDDANNVQVTDYLPPSVSYVSDTDSCTHSSGTLTCNLGTIPAGSGLVFDVTVLAEREGTAVNEATVNADEQDPDLSNNNASESTVIIAGDVDLGVLKSDSVDPVMESSPLTYTLDVENLGPDPALNVKLTDTLPASVTFDSVSSTQGSCSFSGRTVDCDLGTLQSGGTAQVQIDVIVNDLDQDRTILNTAQVSSDGTEMDESNNSALERTSVDAVPPLADLQVTKTDSADPVPFGSSVTYTLTVTNAGPEDATGVVLTDSLPSGAYPLGGTPSQGFCTYFAFGAECALGTIASGDSATVDLVVEFSRTGTFTNVASVAGDQDDPDGSNNSVSETTQVGSVNPVANLELIKTAAPDPVRAGQALTYTLTVENLGPDVATGVQVVDVLPAGVVFDSASSTRGSCVESSGVVTCYPGTMQAGQTATITIVVDTTTGGQLVNTAVVSSNESEPTPANNQDSATTVVAAATTTDIPTADEWALILLTVLLGVVGVFFTRQS